MQLVRVVLERLAGMAAVLLLSALAGCGRGPAGQNGASSTLPERIRVGATLPFGSTNGKAARFYQEGYELAFEQLNRGGGIKLGGRSIPVELKVLDDRDEVPVAAKSISQLIDQDKVDFLLGSYSDRVVEAEAAIAERGRVPYVAASGATRALFQQPHRYVFGVQASIDQLAYTVMRWVDEQQKAGRLPALLKVAVIGDNTPRGGEFRGGVLDFAGKTPSRRASYRVVLDESFEPGQSDFRPLLRRLKAAGADVVLADGSLPDFLSLHRQYVAAGLCHKVLSYGSHGGEQDAFEAFGFDRLSYILSAVWWSSRLARGKHGPGADAHRGLNAQFAEAFKEAFHREPEWYGALAYESIIPGGRLAFGGDQQARYPFLVQQNMPDGKSLIVYPTDAADGQGVAANPKCRLRAGDRTGPPQRAIPSAIPALR
jgi:branched-chain amino acid transport system substrate-binding protein